MSDEAEDALAKLAAMPQPVRFRAHRAEDALRTLRAYLTIVEPSDRVALFAMLQDGYCQHCGDTEPPRCQCANDE